MVNDQPLPAATLGKGGFFPETWDAHRPPAGPPTLLCTLYWPCCRSSVAARRRGQAAALRGDQRPRVLDLRSDRQASRPRCGPTARLGGRLLPGGGTAWARLQQRCARPGPDGPWRLFAFPRPGDRGDPAGPPRGATPGGRARTRRGNRRRARRPRRGWRCSKHGYASPRRAQQPRDLGTSCFPKPRFSCRCKCYTLPPSVKEQSFDTAKGATRLRRRLRSHQVHAERVVTLANQSLQLEIVANDENYALAA